MRKIKLLLSYDGTPYFGWQKQPGHPTIQGTLEAVLTQMYSEPIRTVGSGRTDTGVHAVAQVAHFESEKIFSNEAKLVRGLNALLPDTIVVKGAWEAPPDFHALHSCRRKTYIYKIWNQEVPSALWHHRALWIDRKIDVERLNLLSRLLVGQMDFKSFQSTGTPVKTTVRTIDVCQWTAKGPILELRIRGSGFLKQMVRNIVGTLLHLERHHGEPTDLLDILEARDRRAAKATAAAHGLYLYRAEYPATLDNKCRKL